MPFITKTHFNLILKTLNSIGVVIESTYAHDEDGNRDQDGEPDGSAADIFEQVCNLEAEVAKAQRIMEGYKT